MTQEKATFSTSGPLPIAYQIERMAEADVPDHFREEREECGEDVGDGEVQDEEVHASHLRPAKWIDICSFFNAPRIFTVVISVFSSLCIPAFFRTDHDMRTVTVGQKMNGLVIISRGLVAGRGLTLR